MLPIDPHADASRWAWLPCPRCPWGRDTCQDCRSGRNCGTHWQYLLSNRATELHLQCPSCAALWSTDTRNRPRTHAVGQH
ncbi:hypothetical protein CKW46_16055 [Mycobacterium liflandii]|nr:hypothetical protein CKW46_16055 [Mycobacterium liflandii]